VNNPLDVQENDMHAPDFAFHVRPFSVLVSLDFSIGSGSPICVGVVTG
jgi:hypothetical protein